MVSTLLLGGNSLAKIVPHEFLEGARAPEMQICAFFGVLLFFFRAFSWSSQGNSLAKITPDKISEGAGQPNPRNPL